MIHHDASGESKQNNEKAIFQNDLYLCSTKQPVATRKPLDGGYGDLDYRYLYKIPWPQLVGTAASASTSQQQKIGPKGNNNNVAKTSGRPE